MGRLDIAMFNAILRGSDDEMPTDPVSDPISDSKVLPIPAGKSGFRAAIQLKNAVSSCLLFPLPFSSLFITRQVLSHKLRAMTVTLLQKVQSPDSRACNAFI